MIYLGPVSGRGGRWTSIAVPGHGRQVTGHVSACPRRRPKCVVMDTIAHSTMGHLVVGNYDLKPTVRGGVVSGNAFIYNLNTRRYTLLGCTAACPPRARSTASGRTAARAARGTRWRAAQRRAAASAAC